jgi:hypothetical protein
MSINPEGIGDLVNWKEEELAAYDLVQHVSMELAMSQRIIAGIQWRILPISVMRSFVDAV